MSVEADFALRALVCTVLALAAVCDFRSRRIPNQLLLLLALLGVLLVATTGTTLSTTPFSWQGLGLSLALVLGLTLPGYLAGVLGAGDVKLMLVLALLLGVGELLWAIALGCLVLACAGGLLRRERLPMAPFLALGTGAVVLPWSWL